MNAIPGCLLESLGELFKNTDAWDPVPEILIYLVSVGALAPSFFFFFNIFLEYNCFTMVC